MYLGVETTACIMIGGLIRLFIDKAKMSESRREKVITNGTLFGSGMVAGEGLIGILLAVFTITGIGDKINFADKIGGTGAIVIGAVVLALIIGVYFVSSFAGTKKEEAVSANEE
jgi:uncharacterized oligopeptide transporter (OPT) family protein